VSVIQYRLASVAPEGLRAWPVPSLNNADAGTSTVMGSATTSFVKHERRNF
jgi:hypothetical protein